MKSLGQAIDTLLQVQSQANKPLAVILAGHNGSGKSTMWYGVLADLLQIPLINADRMMMSILPEKAAEGDPLPDWATSLRDRNADWMVVAQKGVEAFVAQALARTVPFAMETVFSQWIVQPHGKIDSKIDLIRAMQTHGYFVILIFVGLSSHHLSIGRVLARVAKGGHAVDIDKLESRFPRTQFAVQQAAPIADATILSTTAEVPKRRTQCAESRLARNSISIFGAMMRRQK